MATFQDTYIFHPCEKKREKRREKRRVRERKSREGGERDKGSAGDWRNEKNNDEWRERKKEKKKEVCQNETCFLSVSDSVSTFFSFLPTTWEEERLLILSSFSLFYFSFSSLFLSSAISLFLLSTKVWKQFFWIENFFKEGSFLIQFLAFKKLENFTFRRFELWYTWEAIFLPFFHAKVLDLKILRRWEMKGERERLSSLVCTTLLLYSVTSVAWILIKIRRKKKKKEVERKRERKKREERNWEGEWEEERRRENWNDDQKMFCWEIWEFFLKILKRKKKEERKARERGNGINRREKQQSVFERKREGKEREIDTNSFHHPRSQKSLNFTKLTDWKRVCVSIAQNCRNLLLHFIPFFSSSLSSSSSLFILISSQVDT